MSKEGSFTRYVCDRDKSNHADGKEARAYVRDGYGADEARWHEVTRLDATGGAQTYLLCDACYAEHVERCQRADAEFAAWLGPKGA